MPGTGAIVWIWGALWSIRASAQTPDMAPTPPPPISKTASPAPTNPCGFGSPRGHDPMGSYLHEFLQKARSANHQDERAFELENELSTAVNCLVARVDGLTQALKPMSSSDPSSLPPDLVVAQLREANANLREIATTLRALPGKFCTVCPKTSTPPTPDVSSVTEITEQLLRQNQIVRDIEKDLRSDLGSKVPMINYAVATAQVSSPDSTARQQIDPVEDVRPYYPGGRAAVQFALASIPDPRVPRHRRQYDNAIAAINQGMLHSGFVLDRYAFPWAQDLQSKAATALSQVSNGAAEVDRAARLPVQLDDRYGLMLFRRDLWREPVLNTLDVEVRAVYLLPETATYGVQARALTAALEKIDRQLAAHSTDLALAHTSDCEPRRPGAALFFGPTFSGSLDSIRETMRGRALSADNSRSIQSLCLVSASTTVDSNKKVDSDGRGGALQLLDYRPLARTDQRKLQFIGELAQQIWVPFKHVAIVYESTVFGIESCKRYLHTTRNVAPLCESALLVPVPVNIADVRFGLRQKLAALKSESKGPLPALAEDPRLTLEDGAENGSEFPESQQSPLTSVSTEFELDRLIESLQNRGSELIVVIATDVRDRLFLIEQIHARIHNALFVDLGADRLLGDSGFIHATRGTLTLASTPLAKMSPETGANLQTVWSTDEQATLAQAISDWPPSWEKPPLRDTDAEKKLYPYVVSRAGLVSSEDVSGNPCLRAFAVSTSILAAIAFAIWGFVAVVRLHGTGWLRRIPVNRQMTWTIGRAVLISAVLLSVFESFTIALGLGIAVLCVHWWSKQAKVTWASVLTWLAALSLLGTGLSELVWTGVWGSATWVDKSSPALDMRPVLQMLSQIPRGGLAYPIAQWIAIAALSAALTIGLYAARINEQCDSALASGLTPKQLRYLHNPLANTGLIVLFIGILTAVLAPLAFGLFRAHQVTLFGWLADFSAFIGLTATSLMAVSMLAGAVATATRIDRLRDLVLEHLRRAYNLQPQPGQPFDPLVWSPHKGRWPEFVATPVAASRWAGSSTISTIRRRPQFWAETLHRFFDATPVSSRSLRALYALFALEMWIYQLCVIGVVITAVAGGIIVYLFPVSQAPGLITVNFLALLGVGIFSGFKAVQFEGDVVLSNVLCNRSEAREWSAPLFACIAIPFVALAVIVAIGQIPGVLSVGNGVLEVLLHFVKPGG